MKSSILIILISLVIVIGCEKNHPVANNIENDSEEVISNERVAGKLPEYCCREFEWRGPSCLLNTPKDCACFDIVITPTDNAVAYSTFQQLFEAVKSDDPETTINVIIKNEDLLSKYINTIYLKGMIDKSLVADITKNDETNTNYLQFISATGDNTQKKNIVFVYPIILK